MNEYWDNGKKNHSIYKMRNIDTSVVYYKLIFI